MSLTEPGWRLPAITSAPVISMRHVTLARQLKADAGAWYDMKRILPLLAKPQFYNRLKSGRARGGEAVILVENIRSYYDILVRNEPPLPITLAKSPENAGKAKGKHGIKLKH